MIRSFFPLMTVMSALSAVTLFAQAGPGNVAEGTLVLAKKSYTVAHGLAYEATIDDEPSIVVVLSGQPISSEMLTAARGAEKDGGDGEFGLPFLKLIFQKNGELRKWSAAAKNTSLNGQSGTATGGLKLGGGRASGKITQPLASEAMIPSEFNVHFDIPLLKPGESLPASTPMKRGPAANVKPTVTGVFKGNGKEAKIAYVSAHWREPFDGKPSIVLVFSEKDHSKDPKPDFNASFGKFGSSLTISVHEDGGILGCEVAHSAHEKRGFSSLGSIHMSDFSYADGKVSGELTTDGQLDTFGETWEVKLKFVAPLGEIPKEFQVPEPTKPAKKETATANDEPAIAGGSAEDEPASPPAAGTLKVKDLALTSDATNVEYQAMMEHVVFQSVADVKSVCAELATKLKAQGWKSDGADMIQPSSSILHRSRGEASLTIFVKPGPGGSNVQIFTEGLAWEG